jgi:D-xylose 1-dehydrogenase (NADP+, D-xylono-1,5-lactone-forming)
MTDKFKWGILGCANISRTIIDAMKLAKNGTVHAIASRDIKKAQEWQQLYGIEKACGSYIELLEMGGINAVYIPVPNSMHAEWCLKAIERGIPVLCEKPFALNAEQSLIVAEASSKSEIPVAEAFMYRFHPLYDKVLNVIAQGKIGKLSTIFSRFTFMLDDPASICANPELGGGALMDVGCYCVNLSRLITGCEPVRAASYSIGNKVDETMTGMMEFPDGILAHFETGISSFERHYAEIAGTEGAIIINSPWFPGEKEGSFILRTNSGDEIITTPGANCYTLELEDFMNAVINNRPPRWNAEDAVKNMAVIDTLYGAL